MNPPHWGGVGLMPLVIATLVPGTKDDFKTKALDNILQRERGSSPIFGD